MSTLDVGGKTYRLVALEPHVVQEVRTHTRNGGARCAAEWPRQRQRSVVQLSLRDMDRNTLPFCGGQGGLELERLLGHDTLIVVGQGIADAHDIFEAAGANPDEHIGAAEDGSTVDKND